MPVIAQLVHADEDTVRDVIHRFNKIGLACHGDMRGYVVEHLHDDGAVLMVDERPAT